MITVTPPPMSRLDDRDARAAASIDNPAAVRLIYRHLTDVMSQPDPTERRHVVPEIYTPNCFIIGPDEAMALGSVDQTRYGYCAINAAARRLHFHRQNWRFAILESASDGQDVASVRWSFGPVAEPSRHVGVDIGLCASGRIEALFSMLDLGGDAFDLNQLCATLSHRTGHVERRSHQSWVRDAHKQVSARTKA